MNTCCWRRRNTSGPEWWDAFQTATKRVTMLKYKDCCGTHSKEVQRCWGMRRSGRKKPPRPSRGRPRKDGSPAQARTTTTTGQEATRNDPVPGSSDNRLQQPTTETRCDWAEHRDRFRNCESEWRRSTPRSVENGSRRRYFNREQARRRLRSKQPVRRSLTDDETVSKRLTQEATVAAIKQEILKTVAERARFGGRHTKFTQASELWGVRVDSCIENGRDQQVARKRRCWKVESSSSDGKRGTNVQCTLGGWTTQGEVTICGQGLREHTWSDDVCSSQWYSSGKSGRIQGSNSKSTACSRSMWRRRIHILGRMNLSFWNRHQKRLRNMVIACGGRSEWYMDVVRVQDRGRSTLVLSSEVRTYDSEVSQWNHIQSVRHSTTCARQMEWLSFTWMTDTGAGRRRLLQDCWHFSLRKLRWSTCKESGVTAMNTWKLWKYVTGRNWRASRTWNISSQRWKSWRWAIVRGVFLQNWTRRASMVTTRNRVKNRRQGSDPQCLLCCISATKERTSKAQSDLLCTKLKSPTALEMRHLKRLLKYVKGTEDMSTVCEMRDSNDRREQLIKRLEVYTDSDWASDQVTRKSTSGSWQKAWGCSS